MANQVGGKTELEEGDIAIALLQGGLSYQEVTAVMNHIKFDKSVWDGSKVIKTSVVKDK